MDIPIEEDQAVLLLVEDEVIQLRLFEYHLGKQYAVRTAHNGHEALAVLGDYHPDIIISDVMMPVMDGFSLFSALQADENTQHIPFILMSVMGDDGALEKAKMQGITHYLQKPFDIKELLHMVALCLGD